MSSRDVRIVCVPSLTDVVCDCEAIKTQYDIQTMGLNIKIVKVLNQSGFIHEFSDVSCARL